MAVQLAKKQVTSPSPAPVGSESVGFPDITKRRLQSTAYYSLAT